MNTKRQVTFELSGILVGTIFMPAVECEKQFDYKYTMTSANQRPFYGQHDKLESAIDHVLNDGDFQSCKILDGQLVVSYWQEPTNGKSRAQWTKRYYNLADFPQLDYALL